MNKILDFVALFIVGATASSLVTLYLMFLFHAPISCLIFTAGIGIVACLVWAIDRLLGNLP